MTEKAYNLGMEDHENVISVVDVLLVAYGLRTYTALCERLTELAEKLVSDIPPGPSADYLSGAASIFSTHARE